MRCIKFLINLLSENCDILAKSLKIKLKFNVINSNGN